MTKNHSWRDLGDPLGALGGQDLKKEGCTPTFGASWGHLGAVLGASWGRLGAWIAVLGRLGALLSRLKIDVKIDQKINAFQDRFLMRFWWILEGKMEPSWLQNRFKIDVDFENRFLYKKRLVFLSEKR